MWFKGRETEEIDTGGASAAAEGDKRQDIDRQQSEGRDLYKDLADPDMPKLLYEWVNSVERDLYGGD